MNKTSKIRSEKSETTSTPSEEVIKTVQPDKNDLKHLDLHPLLIQSKHYELMALNVYLNPRMKLNGFSNELFLSESKRQYELSLNDMQLPMRLFESLTCLTDVTAILFTRDYWYAESSMTPYLLLTMGQAERNHFLASLDVPQIPNDGDVRNVGELLSWMRKNCKLNKRLLGAKDGSEDVTEFLLSNEDLIMKLIQIDKEALNKLKSCKNLGEVLLWFERKRIRYRVAFEHVWLFLTMDNDLRKKVSRVIKKGINLRRGVSIPMVKDDEVRTVGAYMEWMDQAATAMRFANLGLRITQNEKEELQYLLNDSIKKVMMWERMGETILSRHQRRVPFNIDALHTVSHNVKLQILEHFGLKLRDISKLSGVAEIDYFFKTDTNLTLVRKASLFSPFWKVLLIAPNERVKYLTDWGVWSWKTANPKQALEKVKNIGELLIWMNKHGVWSNECAKVEEQLSELERGEEKDKYLKHKAELEELNAERERLLAIVKPAKQAKYTKKTK